MLILNQTALMQSIRKVLCSMMIKIRKYLIRKTNILITFSLHYLNTQFGSFFHLTKVHTMNLIILIGLLPLVTVSFFTFEYKTFAEICTLDSLINVMDGISMMVGKFCKILVLKFTTYQQISNFSVFLEFSTYV